MKRNTRAWLLSVAVATAVALSACAGSDTASTATEPTAVQPEATAAPEPTTAPEPTLPPEAAPTPEATPTPEAVPFETASARLAVDSVVDVLNGERELSPDEYRSAFGPSFRQQVPFEEFQGFNSQLIAQSPWTIVETLNESANEATYLVTNGADARFAIDVRITNGRISTLLLQQWTDPSFGIDDALDRFNAAGEFAYVAAQVSADTTCRTISEKDSDRVMPLGSVFKLLVLGAVVDAVDAGTISWDQPVTIRDELDSYRSGVTQDIPAGETRTVRELAEGMISISDNSATDHLLFLVGRMAVEDAQERWGVSDPDLNRPFFSTRELFHLKLDAELGQRYLASSVEERRAILEDLASLPLPPVELVDSEWTAPIAVTTLEWFATPSDICQVLARLAEDTEALRILEINPGVPSTRWAAVGFKGGSEPGVLAVSWIMTDDDGGRWAVAGAVWSETETGSPDPFVEAFATIRDQLVVDGD